MNIQKLIEQHIDNYSCKDESIIAYRRQHLLALEAIQNRKQELKGAEELAIEIANMIQKLLE